MSKIAHLRRLPKKNPQPAQSSPHIVDDNVHRQLNYESLEDRRVLSASSWDVVLDDPTGPEPSSALVSGQETEQEVAVFQATSDSATMIDSLQLKVNGELLEVTENWQQLDFNIGDEVEIVGITYTYDGAEPDGVFAAETYVNKLSDLSNASLVDYNDGRFSDPANDVASNAGQATHAGVEGSWVLEEGWDRLTVNLMHYTSDGATVAGRFSIQLEVGEPDFAFDLEEINQIKNQTITVGDSVQIPVGWINNGQGTFHNYAEVDVFRGDQSGPLVWAGAVVGNSNAENQVKGPATNTRGDYSEFWTPDAPGTYTLLYTVDPESVWSESDESNNEYTIVIEVLSDNVVPVANDDVGQGQEDSQVTVDVVFNDVDPDGDELSVKSFNHGEHGTVSYNEEDGTLVYTPEEGFSGEDQFEYIVNDGEADSNVAVVKVSIQQKDTGLEVSNAQGNEDKWIDLNIELDTQRYEAVQIDGLPDGAKLSDGKSNDDGSITVKAKDLSKLQVRAAANSDVDFSLTVTPISQDGALVEANSEALNVTVDPVYDGGRLRLFSFGIEAGTSGSFPHQIKLIDNDGSEVHTVTIKNLPDYLMLSAGHREGSDWVLAGTDLNRDLKVVAGFAEDTSGWTSYGSRYVYTRISLDTVFEGHEQDGGAGESQDLNFDIYFFQRV